MKTDRLFADYQLAHMEHSAFNTEASKEKLELAKLAYDNALAKEQEALAPAKVEAPKDEAPAKVEVPKDEAPAKADAPAKVEAPKDEAPAKVEVPKDEAPEVKEEKKTV